MNKFLEGDGQNYKSLPSWVYTVIGLALLGNFCFSQLQKEPVAADLNTNAQIETVARTATHNGPGF